MAMSDVFYVAGVIAAFGGFYALTNFRVKALEKKFELLDDTRERLVRIEENQKVNNNLLMQVLKHKQYV